MRPEVLSLRHRLLLIDFSHTFFDFLFFSSNEFLVTLRQILAAVNNFLPNKTAYRLFSRSITKKWQTEVECFHKAESPLDVCW